MAAGKRPTTYDATVGSIVQEGEEIDESRFKLPTGHRLRVISAETFDVPNNVNWTCHFTNGLDA